mmetsp:Transcript_16387/g.35645  ORF Transcript_16387/g.35645 Transcript_16387/m.35645 type:complete len:205 (+) Transcript_16387:574-1188(+)
MMSSAQYIPLFRRAMCPGVRCTALLYTVQTRPRPLPLPLPRPPIITYQLSSLSLSIVVARRVASRHIVLHRIVLYRVRQHPRCRNRPGSDRWCFERTRPCRFARRDRSEPPPRRWRPSPGGPPRSSWSTRAGAGTSGAARGPASVSCGPGWCCSGPSSRTGCSAPRPQTPVGRTAAHRPCRRRRCRRRRHPGPLGAGWWLASGR